MFCVVYSSIQKFTIITIVKTVIFITIICTALEFLTTNNFRHFKVIFQKCTSFIAKEWNGWKAGDGVSRWNWRWKTTDKDSME